MNNLNKLYILTANEISEILSDREKEIIDTLGQAYQCHGLANDFLPHSVFLKFPNNLRNRVIALPAYLGGNFEKSGIKWITSYPGNHELGLDRASAIIILNSFETGRPLAVMEGSIISAKRTAGGAALAARHLVADKNPEKVGLIGCGLINFETLRFLLKEFPSLKKVSLYDLNVLSSENFKEKAEQEFDGLQIEIITETSILLRDNALISIATNSVKPHLNDISECPDGSTILNISLRDFTPEVIESAVNIVDDISHVCRAQTSIHLTEEKLNSRDFIRSDLPDVILNRIKGRQNNNEKIIYSPFGLGILDIALSDMVYKTAVSGEMGIKVDSFLPDYWLNRK
jgi:N-[(2S)-2-amino-2-carboxyethyl]-L-glutamate dehydrogenase